MIYIGTNSTGGTGYLTRIIKEAQEPKTVDVIVEVGEFQEEVFSTIKHQVDMLEHVATLDFKIHLVKEKG